jgi:hypothetical protein
MRQYAKRSTDQSVTPMLNRESEGGDVRMLSAFSSEASAGDVVHQSHYITLH